MNKIFWLPIHSHDFGFGTVGPLCDQIDALQVFWRDDPRLNLQAPAVCVEIPAYRWHSCYKQTFKQKTDFFFK